MSPLVSVIMPAHNEERYLPEAVESILSQTWKDFEFLIANDGSTDRTGQILDEYAARDPRIRVFHQSNIGLTKTLNKLIGAARGDLIARQDADDRSHPQRFERQVEGFTKYPATMLLGTGCYIIDPAGHAVFREKVLCNSEKIRRRMPRKNCFVHGSVMFRAAVFKEAGLYYEEFRFAEDYDLFLRIIEKFEARNINLPLYYYRINPESISCKRVREQLFMGMIVKKAARLRKQANPPEWSPALYQQLADSLGNYWSRRTLTCAVSLARGRNFYLVGNWREARKQFATALLNVPSPRPLYHLLRTLLPFKRLLVMR